MVLGAIPAHDIPGLRLESPGFLQTIWLSGQSQKMRDRIAVVQNPTNVNLLKAANQTIQLASLMPKEEDLEEKSNASGSVDDVMEALSRRSSTSNTSLYTLDIMA